MVVVKWLLTNKRDAVNLQYHRAALFYVGVGLKVKLRQVYREKVKDHLSVNGIGTGVYPTLPA